MMRRWSEEAWIVAKPVYDKILTLPFVKELSEGALPKEKFLFYLHQDSLDIDNYARILSHIASRLTAKRHVEDFLRFAIDGVEVEKTMHSVFLKGSVPGKDEMSPTCLLYSSVLGSTALAPVEAEAAAVLPCFWIYEQVGKHIMRTSVPDNPYKQWIDTYGAPAFEASTIRAIEICDELAESCSKSSRDLMTYYFLLCTKMEWMFWDSAYNFEKWKI